MSRPAAGGPLLVAIDVGTTGARASAVDLEGRVLAEVRRPYRISSPHPGWAEQDPDDWEDRAVEALVGLVRRVRRPERIAAIGLTGQCPTVAPFGARGRPVGPGMLYRDNRAVVEAAGMRRLIGVRTMHRRTGHTAAAFHIGPKVLWLRAHEPKVFAATRRLLQPRDVVLRRLTGREATDETHANATLFFDLRARAWAPDLVARFDVDPSLFPEALASRAVAGTLRPAAAREVGLDRRVVVVMGAADSQCVAFGAGVVDPGPVSEMAGSSTCLNSSVLEPLPDPRVTHYSHVVPARYTTELGLNTTGAAVRWALERFGFERFDALDRSVRAFRRRLEAADLSSREAAPIFLPYLGDGERDDPGIRAAFVGLSERHDRAALAYAVLEGIALGIRAELAVLREAGSPVEELRVAGGAARLAGLGQLKADVLGVPVLHLEADTATIGAAMLAGEAAGLEREVGNALGQILRRARRFEPADPGCSIGGERARWFDEVRAAAALRIPAGGVA
jgi:xylulokinase